jgi:hypothetical protein
MSRASDVLSSGPARTSAAASRPQFTCRDADGGGDQLGGAGAGFTRLSLNENPFGRSPLAVEAIQDVLIEIARYAGDDGIAAGVYLLVGRRLPSSAMGYHQITAGERRAGADWSPSFQPASRPYGGQRPR